ncbi:hypothetical protein CK203_020868 [Vitis vinifera]|uniref:Uncharacterized protein n=1 Tax=Vitis vinifera TaxID=29760 RepID=A0A438IHL4_VITVI|nr:hypothetical protein CK203_020868 [Vitis vinifera]
MLAYVDFFLGGDEKRTDLPPRLHQRFPLSLVFGGDGSYLAPFSLHNDNILTSLMSQSVPPTIWYRLVAAGLKLMQTLPYAHMVYALIWLGFSQQLVAIASFGLLVCASEDESVPTSVEGVDGSSFPEHLSRTRRGNLPDHLGASEHLIPCKKIFGGILHAKNLQKLQEKSAICYPFSFIIHNTKPVGHQDLVGLVISALLLGDISLVLLTLLQIALFTHGPRRSAGLARVCALWNITSLINVVIAFICGFFHYKSKKHVNFQSWNFSMDESEWWMLPSGLVLCKIIQARLINRHVANLEIQDHSLYSNDPNVFWES